jgi:hypothetical protein
MAIVTVNVDEFRAPATPRVLESLVSALADAISCPAAPGGSQIHELRPYVWTSFSCSVCDNSFWARLCKAPADSSNLQLHARLPFVTPLDSEETFRDQILPLAYRLSAVPMMLPLEPSSMRCRFEHGIGTFKPEIERANGRWSASWRCENCGTSLSVTAW